MLLMLGALRLSLDGGRLRPERKVPLPLTLMGDTAQVRVQNNACQRSVEQDPCTDKIVGHACHQTHVCLL